MSEPTGSRPRAAADPPALDPWPRTSACAIALTAGLLLLLVGALGGRPDVALVAAAPVVGAAWDLARRPAGSVRASVRPADEGQTGGELRSVLRVEGPPGTDAALLRVRRPGSGTVEVLVRVTGTRELPVTVRTVRTGPQDLVHADVQALGAGLATIAEPVRTEPHSVMVLPAPRPLGALPLPWRLRGLTGAHESRRPGDGGGLRDVHPFSAGDRLRRIDWRVTARRAPDLSELYVRRAYALADAVVVLVVDSRDDVGPDPATWGGMRPVRPEDATSLDVAREAAASVAQQLVAVGDRVGLDDLGARRRPVAPGGGRRQLARIVHSLALTRPEGEVRTRVRPPQLPSGALVVVFSTFLDDDAAQAAGSWRRSGHRVVAVDVLPRVRDTTLSDQERLALRLVSIERADRLAALTAAGVELVAWATGDPWVDLGQLARQSHRRPGVGAGR
ncbi:DUF58 domain-containing protein [Cellulomonas cellasea]|uniref:DUF58 domain-containing protein n=2 Tax=Cellulomonas cellasea TaxID=43670 RepID=A0A4Y3KSL1_9CELL|nr:DUF58 domain-containing protein [Cellulomonas cellasea]GEA86973.1 hypothetical protein CCE01nite_09220 [Cellulomonas cellasea]